MSMRWQLSGIGLALASAAAVISLAATGVIARQVAGSAVAIRLGPAGYGQLRLDMDLGRALATGELKPHPLFTSGGCTEYAFAAGPQPDPAAIAAMPAAEAKAAEAQRRLTEARAGMDAVPDTDTSLAGLQEKLARLNAATAALQASLAAADEESKAHTRLFDAIRESGSVSVSGQGVRLIGGPPGARTPEGVGRGSTVADLKAAYGARSLGNRYVAFISRTTWAYTFFLTNDTVTSFHLENLRAGCHP